MVRILLTLNPLFQFSYISAKLCRFQDVPFLPGLKVQGVM
jgi:hypothetical protein